MTSVLSIAGDTDGLRASEGYHAIEYTRTDRHLGGLRASCARPQTGAREYLEPVHQGLGERSPVVAARLLLRSIAAIAALRQVAPGVRSGHGFAPSRGGIDGLAPRAAIRAWQGLVS